MRGAPTLSKPPSGLAMFALGGDGPCLGGSKGQFYRKALSVKSTPKERATFTSCCTLWEFHDTYFSAEKPRPKRYTTLPVPNIETKSWSRHKLKVEGTMSSIPFREVSSLDPSLVPQWLLQKLHHNAASRVSRSIPEQVADTWGGFALAPATSNLRGSSHLQTEVEVHTVRSEPLSHTNDMQQKASRSRVPPQPKERETSEKYQSLTESYANLASLNGVRSPWVQDSHIPRYVAHGTPPARDHTRSRHFVQQSKFDNKVGSWYREDDVVQALDNGEEYKHRGSNGWEGCKDQIQPVTNSPFVWQEPIAGNEFVESTRHFDPVVASSYPPEYSYDPTAQAAYSGYSGGGGSEEGGGRKGKRKRDDDNRRGGDKGGEDEGGDEDSERPKKVSKKTPIACKFCRGRKLKCDGRKPCGNCARRGRECIYDPVVRRRGLGKKTKMMRSEGGQSQQPQAESSTTSTVQAEPLILVPPPPPPAIPRYDFPIRGQIPGSSVRLGSQMTGMQSGAPSLHGQPEMASRDPQHQFQATAPHHFRQDTVYMRGHTQTSGSGRPVHGELSGQSSGWSEERDELGDHSDDEDGEESASPPGDVDPARHYRRREGD